MPVRLPLTCEVCGRAFVGQWYGSRGVQKCCSRACSDSRKPREPILARFLRLIDLTLPNEVCWPWAGDRSKQGYGRFFLDPACGLMTAHRASYLLFRGPIPAGLLVLHRCDNPPCVNPGHLFTGTQLENMADCIAKGRFRKRPEGQDSPSAKVTWAEVEAARAMRAEGALFSEIAARLGLCETQARNIIHGRCWKRKQETKHGD